MTIPSVPAPCPSPVAAVAATRGPDTRRLTRRAVLRAYLPAGAGVAYLVAWVAGLAAWPVNLPLNATAAQTTASYAAQPAQAVVQYLLVEGLAGLLLGIVLGCALLPRIRGGGALRAGGAALLGAVAAGTSLAQCVIGLVLTSAATGHDIVRGGDLSNLVNRLDGVKMLAIAAAAVLLASLGGRVPALPRWLRATALPLAAALIASGYAYLALSQPLAWTAYLSGTLLLLWVTGVGIARTTRMRAGRVSQPGDDGR
jgi:hypothetical protein